MALPTHTTLCCSQGRLSATVAPCRPCCARTCTPHRPHQPLSGRGHPDRAVRSRQRIGGPSTLTVWWSQPGHRPPPPLTRRSSLKWVMPHRRFPPSSFSFSSKARAPFALSPSSSSFTGRRRATAGSKSHEAPPPTAPICELRSCHLSSPDGSRITFPFYPGAAGGHRRHLGSPEPLPITETPSPKPPHPPHHRPAIAVRISLPHLVRPPPRSALVEEVKTSSSERPLASHARAHRGVTARRSAPRRHTGRFHGWARPAGRSRGPTLRTGFFIFIFFYNSRNCCKLLKYIENGIKLGKNTKQNSLEFFKLDLYHRLDQILF
jgi:hypothetical protein